MRSVQKTKVQIFPVWTEQIGQEELYCIASIMFVYENLSFVSRSIRVLGGPYGWLGTDLGLTNQICLAIQ